MGAALQEKRPQEEGRGWTPSTRTLGPWGASGAWLASSWGDQELGTLLEPTRDHTTLASASPKPRPRQLQVKALDGPAVLCMSLAQSDRNNTG